MQQTKATESYASLAQRREKAVKIIKLLRIKTASMTEPAASSIVKKYGKDPFLILVSCLLSLRTRDSISLPASLNLFKKVKTAEELRKMPLKELEAIIYSVGFYRQKARQLKEMSKDLIERFGGKVPDTPQELRSIKGVGAKTANLVLGTAFDIPAICVDTHVHRISNRLGLVKTKKPEETERELKEILPEEYWIEYNRLMVMWGQNICLPISPLCSQCVLFKLCPKIGVTQRR